MFLLNQVPKVLKIKIVKKFEIKERVLIKNNLAKRKRKKVFLTSAWQTGRRLVTSVEVPGSVVNVVGLEVEVELSSGVIEVSVVTTSSAPLNRITRSVEVGTASETEMASVTDSMTSIELSVELLLTEPTSVMLLPEDTATRPEMSS